MGPCSSEKAFAFSGEFFVKVHGSAVPPGFGMRQQAEPFESGLGVVGDFGNVLALNIEFLDEALDHEVC